MQRYADRSNKWELIITHRLITPIMNMSCISNELLQLIIKGILVMSSPYSDKTRKLSVIYLPIIYQRLFSAIRRTHS